MYRLLRLSRLPPRRRQYLPIIKSFHNYSRHNYNRHAHSVFLSLFLVVTPTLVASSEQQKSSGVAKSANDSESFGEKVSIKELQSRFELVRKEDGGFFELGVGAYGQVIKARDKFSGRHVAIKVVEKTCMTSRQIRNEVESLRVARMHPNVVELVEVLDSVENNSWYIVTELCEGGELFDRLVEDGPFGEGRASLLVARIVDALEHIHSHGYVHLDIKPENMVFKKPRSKNTDGLDIRLVDFGMARNLRNVGPDGFQVKDDVGTTAYWPPEMLEPFYVGEQAAVLPGNERSIHLTTDPRSCDMWAVGVILFILLLGCHPFDPAGKATESELAMNIIDGKRASTEIHGDLKILSAQVKDLIEKLLNRDPEKRITAKEVLAHPWIQQYVNCDTGNLQDRALPRANSRLKSFVEESKSSRIVSTALLYASLKSMTARFSKDKGTSSEKPTDFLQTVFAMLDTKGTGKIQKRDVDALYNALSMPSDDEREGLTYEGFMQLVNKKFAVRYKKGDVVFSKGDTAEGMYVILSGSAQLNYAGPRNSVRPVARLVPGDAFGETALLDGRCKRNATVRCVEDMEVVFWGKHDFIKALSRSPVLTSQFERMVFRRQNQRARSILDSTVDALSKTLPKGSVLFEEGDESDSLYMIQSGTVEASVLTSKARQGGLMRWFSQSDDKCVIKTYGPGDIFGYGAVLGARRKVTARCVTEVQLIEVSQREIKKILDEPSLRHNLLRFSRRLSEATWASKTAKKS